MSLANTTPGSDSPIEPPATNTTLKPWNVLMGNVALRRLPATNVHHQANIEELGPDGGWAKIGLVESKIGKEEPGIWPQEELTRIFLQDRCAAVITTLPQGRTLTIDGVGNWRYNETKSIRVVGLERGLPTIRVKAISGMLRIGGPIKIIEDDTSGTEIARFREMRARRPREETDFPIRMLPARWRAPFCAPPRLFQSFGPPEMFAQPAMVPLIAAVALRQLVVDHLARAA